MAVYLKRNLVMKEFSQLCDLKALTSNSSNTPDFKEV